MKGHLSDQIRTVAQARFVKPAHDAGKRDFSIAVRELMDMLEAQGFPRNHTPQICNALQTEKFLRSNGLKITRYRWPKVEDQHHGSNPLQHYGRKSRTRPSIRAASADESKHRSNPRLAQSG